MSDVAEVTPVTAALLVALKTIGRPIGDARKPSSPNKPPASFYPYAILYVGTSLLDGNFVHPHEDGVHRAQVTSVGLTRDSVDWMRDRAREVLLGTDLEIDGHAVVWAELSDGSQPVSRDDDVTPSVFYAPDVFRLYVTPASSGS